MAPADMVLTRADFAAIGETIHRSHRVDEGRALSTLACKRLAIHSCPMDAKRSGTEPTSVGQDGFDLDAAWLRRAQGDLGAFTEALAIRLEAAMPGIVTVERRRDGLFSRKTHVTAIAVRLPTGLLSLEAGHGRLQATRARVVRGVSIGSEEITVPAWLDEVMRSTQVLGRDADAAHEALHAFLTS